MRGTFISSKSVGLIGHRAGYSCNHVLIQPIENWKSGLDENFQIGTVLNRYFISSNTLIGIYYAYGLSEETTTYSYSYLKRRGQRVRIDDILSSLQALISEGFYPQSNPF